MKSCFATNVKPKIKILIIVKGSNDSGNFITMSRICKNMQLLDKFVKIRFFNMENAVEIETEFVNAYNQWKPSLIVGLNLYRCLFLTNLNLNIRLIMILGGTDINIEMNEKDKLQSIELIKRCMRIVAFSAEMKTQFLFTYSKYLEKTNVKIDVIPQGIDDIEIMENSSENDSIMDNLNVSETFLVIGRLRSVKDPGFLVKPFSNWISISGHEHYSLLYVGNIEENSEDIILFLREIANLSNIHHIGSISQDRLFHLMFKSKGVINCSKSEGQSTALLEAMSIGTPVLARRVPGNIGLIEDNYNGVLFSDQKEFVLRLTQLINIDFAKDLIKNAKEYIKNNHSAMVEAKGYLQLINEFT